MIDTPITDTMTIHEGMEVVDMEVKAMEAMVVTQHTGQATDHMETPMITQ